MSPARGEEMLACDWIHLTNVHDVKQCRPRPCVIHNPTPHHMRFWTLKWRDDKAIFERICVHNVGHPDPDQFEFWAYMREHWRPSLAADVIDDPFDPTKSANPYDGIEVHTCDGCCNRSDHE